MMTLCSTALDHQMPLHNVKMTLHSTGLDHQMAVGREGVMSALGICAFCYMLNFFGVVIFNRSLLNWRGE